MEATISGLGFRRVPLLLVIRTSNHYSHYSCALMVNNLEVDLLVMSTRPRIKGTGL